MLVPDVVISTIIPPDCNNHEIPIYYGAFLCEWHVHVTSAPDNRFSQLQITLPCDHIQRSTPNKDWIFSTQAMW